MYLIFVRQLKHAECVHLSPTNSTALVHVSNLKLQDAMTYK